MVDKIIPAHILRLYSWEILKANGLLEEINGLIPVIPLEDEPQIANAQKSYIIYGYAENNDPVIPEMRRGSIVFNIKARRFNELGSITNALTRAYEGLDIGAHRLNWWKNKDQYAEVFKDILFKTTDVIYVEGGYPEPNQEGGPLIGVIHIVYTCTVEDPDFVWPPDTYSTLWGPKPPT